MSTTHDRAGTSVMLAVSTSTWSLCPCSNHSTGSCATASARQAWMHAWLTSVLGLPLLQDDACGH